MSQFFQGVVAGDLPPTVPTSFVTDNGTVIPAANVVNINGGSTNANNNNGIQVIANPTGSNNEVIQLTNRVFGSVVTSDGAGQVQVVFSFPLGASPASFVFDVSVVGYNRTDSTAAGYTTQATIRTNGISGTGVSVSSAEVQEEGVFSDTEVQYGFSGNNLQLQVTGVAGKTISWSAVGYYVMAS